MTPFTFTLCNLVLFGIVCSALPHLTRRELFFAVTVTSDFRRTETARQIVRRYNVLGWSGALLTLLLLTTGVTPQWVALVPSYASWIASYLWARNMARPHRTIPTSMRQTVLTTQRERFPGGILAASGPFVILAAKAIYTYLHWDVIPGRVPVHWGWNGPDRWVDRSPLTVYGSLAGIAVVCALMILTAYATMHASRRVNVIGDAAEGERKFRKVSVLGLVALAYILAVAIPAPVGGAASIPYAPVWILITATIYIAMLIRYGQGGERLGSTREEQSIVSNPPVGDRTPDECWKVGGFFYYNPNDPALVVEKRFGIGWTLNFGNRWSWMIIPIVLLPLFLNRIG